MSMVWWMALAFAEEPSAALIGRVEVSVAVMSTAAPGGTPLSVERPASLGDRCPPNAPSAVATTPHGEAVAITACAAGLWWTSDRAEGVWRVAGGVPDGEAAGVALLPDADGALVAIVWTTAGDARLSTWRPHPPAPFVFGVRTLPAGAPLQWPQPAEPGGSVHALAQVDTRFPDGVAIYRAALAPTPAPSGSVVFEASVLTVDGRRAARLTMPRPPKLAPPTP